MGHWWQSVSKLFLFSSVTHKVIYTTFFLSIQYMCSSWFNIIIIGYIRYGITNITNIHKSNWCIELCWGKMLLYNIYISYIKIVISGYSGKEEMEITIQSKKVILKNVKRSDIRCHLSNSVYFNLCWSVWLSINSSYIIRCWANKPDTQVHLRPLKIVINITYYDVT